MCATALRLQILLFSPFFLSSIIRNGVLVSTTLCSSDAVVAVTVFTAASFIMFCESPYSTCFFAHLFTFGCKSLLQAVCVADTCAAVRSCAVGTSNLQSLTASCLKSSLFQCLISIASSAFLMAIMFTHFI